MEGVRKGILISLTIDYHRYYHNKRRKSLCWEVIGTVQRH